MPLLQVMAGQKILFEGRPAAATYLIVSGEVELFTAYLGAKRMVARLGPGGILGEVEILTGSPSLLSAFAAKDCTLLPITAAEFSHRLGHTDPVIGYILKLMAQRLSNMTMEFTHNKLTAPGKRPSLDLSHVSSEFDYWSRLNDTEHDHIQRRNCKAGETIFLAGEPSDYAYILLSGEAEVFLQQQEDGAMVSLAKIRTGEIFGEMALIEGKPRSATVIASSDCELFRIEADQIHAGLANGDPLLSYWMQAVLRHVRHIQKLLRNHLAPNKPTPPNLLAPETLPENIRQTMIDEFQIADELRFLLTNINLSPAERSMTSVGVGVGKPAGQTGHSGKLDYVLLPVVSLKDHKIIALRVRPTWRHPVRGVIGTRQIYELAQKMWLEADLDISISGFCAQNLPQIWRGRRLFTIQPDSLMLIIPVRGGLDEAPEVRGALQELVKALPPGRVILELPEEKTAIANPEKTRRAFANLRENGFRLMLSYSEGETKVLQTLRSQPIDFLRLRPALTAELTAGRNHQLLEQLSTHFHRLSEGQGLHVWADGITSADFEPKLRKLGIEAGSGPIYSQHMPLNETLNLLVQKRTLILTPSPAETTTPPATAAAAT